MCQTLEVVGAYIAWINIALIANLRFVDLLVRFLRAQPLREAAADCLHDIVAKGMEPVAKTKLVESLLSVLDSAGILNIETVGTSFHFFSFFRFLPPPLFFLVIT